MKKITYLFILTTTLILSSCSSSDEDSGASLSDTINYGTEEITITKATVSDWGGSTRYNYDFLVEGTLDGKEYSFYVELYSPVIEGNIEFRTGTFSYNVGTPTEPAFYFNEAYIEIDGIEFPVDGGTITVSGSGTNFSLTTNVMLTNDVTTEVSYDGEFLYQDRK